MIIFINLENQDLYSERPQFVYFRTLFHAIFNMVIKTYHLFFSSPELDHRIINMEIFLHF